MINGTGSATRTLRCLHLSDLHVGMYGQTWLWPTLKHAVFDDLRKIVARQGHIDLVIFSGDLVQRGSREDFDQLDKVLDELWAVFNHSGCKPELVALPGNHDLKRPKENDPFALLLKQWWTLPIVREGFFDDPANVYKKSAASYFMEFQNWAARCRARGFPIRYADQGLLPGDQALRLRINEIEVGIVLLNSTWLQIGPEEYEGRLHVDTKQLLAITADDPQNWCAANDISIIVTHQPFDWLHTESRQHWNSEIAPSGRFDLHMFGHMHRPSTVRSSIGGGSSKMYLQAPSVFGLQQFGDGKQDRIHGYSLLEFACCDDHVALRLLPRKILKMTDGSQRAVPDFEQTLDDDNSITFELRSTNFRVVQKKSEMSLAAPQLSILSASAESSDILNAIRQTLLLSESHSKVTQVELSKSTSFKANGRVFG